MTRRRAGFTLLELLLALSLFTIVAGALYGMLRTAIDAQRVGEQRTTTLQIARIALKRITRDLGAAYVSTGTFSVGFVGTDEVGTDVDIDEVEFVACDNFPREGESAECDLQIVRYYIDDDPETEEEGLVRETKPAVELASEEGDEANLVEIAREIRSLNFRFFDGVDWTDSWDSTETGTLPQAVEVTIGIASPGDESGALERFTTAVALPLRDAVSERDRSEAESPTTTIR